MPFALANFESFLVTTTIVAYRYGPAKSTCFARSAVIDWPAMIASTWPDCTAGIRESQSRRLTFSFQPYASQIFFAIMTS